MQHTMLDANEVSLSVFQGKVGAAKILKMAKTNEIPYVKLGGRYYFSLEKLTEYLDEKMTNPIH